MPARLLLCQLGYYGDHAILTYLLTYLATVTNHLFCYLFRDLQVFLVSLDHKVQLVKSVLLAPRDPRGTPAPQGQTEVLEESDQQDQQDQM